MIYKLFWRVYFSFSKYLEVCPERFADWPCQCWTCSSYAAEESDGTEDTPR